MSKDDLFDVQPQLEAATPEPSLRKIVTEYYARHFAHDEARQLCTDYIASLRSSPPAGVVDSGMSGDAVERAEMLWANLPTGRKWTSLPTHEKALVCHTVERANRDSLAAGREQGVEEAARLCDEYEGFAAAERCDDPSAAISSDIAQAIRALAGRKEGEDG